VFGKSETVAKRSGPVCSATGEEREGERYEVGLIDYLSPGWEVTLLPTHTHTHTHTSDVLLLLVSLTLSPCPLLVLPKKSPNNSSEKIPDTQSNQQRPTNFYNRDIAGIFPSW
jgi:hypothetical protein